MTSSTDFNKSRDNKPEKQLLHPEKNINSLFTLPKATEIGSEQQSGVVNLTQEIKIFNLSKEILSKILKCTFVKIMQNSGSEVLEKIYQNYRSFFQIGNSIDYLEFCSTFQHQLLRLYGIFKSFKNTPKKFLEYLTSREELFAISDLSGSPDSYNPIISYIVKNFYSDKISEEFSLIELTLYQKIIQIKTELTNIISHLVELATNTHGGISGITEALYRIAHGDSARYFKEDDYKNLFKSIEEIVRVIKKLAKIYRQRFEILKELDKLIFLNPSHHANTSPDDKAFTPLSKVKSTKKETTFSLALFIFHLDEDILKKLLECALIELNPLLITQEILNLSLGFQNSDELKLNKFELLQKVNKKIEQIPTLLYDNCELREKIFENILLIPVYLSDDKINDINYVIEHITFHHFRNNLISQYDNFNQRICNRMNSIYINIEFLTDQIKLITTNFPVNEKGIIEIADAACNVSQAFFSQKDDLKKIYDALHEVSKLIEELASYYQKKLIELQKLHNLNYGSPLPVKTGETTSACPQIFPSLSPVPQSNNL